MKIRLNSGIIRDKLNNSLNYYFIKIIQLNKKKLTIYIYLLYLLYYLYLEGYNII